MVKLNRIYTRTGDDGTTGLGTGARVSKCSPRVTAYGSVDEANAALGLCVVAAGGRGGSLEPGSIQSQIAGLLRQVQNDLFDLGADLCFPMTAGETFGSHLRVTAEQTARLERAIDEYNLRLAPLDSFVLPGGTPLGAALHQARVVARRAERDTVALFDQAPAETSIETVRYLNRLSDLLFVLARVANDDGASDIKWVPGANRGSAAEKSQGR